MRKSTRVFMAGAILVAVGAGLFWWGATTDLQPAQGLTKADVMATIGRYAGGIGGAGVGIWVAAVIMRLRGN
jgi:hypothetical protein